MVHIPIELNPQARSDLNYPEEFQAYINDAESRFAHNQIRCWDGYEPTPLYSLSGLANSLDLGMIHFKQEADRFCLRSFKALGGAYAVQQTAGGFRSLANPSSAANAQAPVFTAATDGNHGRSVAWGARRAGGKCVIFVNDGVSQARKQAIADYGAIVETVAGTYDDAVRHTANLAKRNSWHLIADTSDSIHDPAVRLVVHGYTVLATEIIHQIKTLSPPTHVFVQAGVGGLAAAVCATLWMHYGRHRPRIILVEPRGWDCWLQSIRAGKRVVSRGGPETVMAGLACGVPSCLAWKILATGAHAAVVVADADALATMACLADGAGGHPRIVSGESGVAGLAALIAVARNVQARTDLALDQSSSIVVIGSEGATDEESYQKITGRSWEEVQSAKVRS